MLLLVFGLVEIVVVVCFVRQHDAGIVLKDMRTMCQCHIVRVSRIARTIGYVRTKKRCVCLVMMVAATKRAAMLKPPKEGIDHRAICPS